MMMFDIKESDLPVLQTRRALLVVDFQQGLVDDAGVVPTHNPPKLIQNVETLVPVFRQTGTIIWVSSQYEAYRPVNKGTQASENIITDKQVRSAKAAAEELPVLSSVQTSMRMRQMVNKHTQRSSEELPHIGYTNAPLEAENVARSIEDSDAIEAFLSVHPGSKSTNFSDKKSAALLEPLQNVSTSKDMYFTKSHYSAFRSGTLLQTLRSHFITELFICGALSNTSVYATAMDAAMYGYGITLVDDCLGWRGKGRHEQSLASLGEATGCDIVASGQVIADIQKMLARKTGKRPVRQEDHEDLHNMLEMLKLQSEASTKPGPEANDRKGELNTPTVQHSLPPNKPDASDESLVRIPRHIRAAELANGKPRIRSRIMQRRSSPPESKTPEKATNKPKNDKMTTHPEPKAAVQDCPMVEQTSSTENVAASGQKSRPPFDPEDGNCHPPGGRSVERLGDNQQPDPKDASHALQEREQQAQKRQENEASFSGSDAQDEDDDESGPTKGEPICEGDTVVINSLLPKDRAKDIFEKLKNEVQWQRMSHQGGEVPRLVAVQGAIGKDGEIPIYRHPADESPPLLPFSPTVSIIRGHVEKAVGHEVNHCLIQFYRDGKDYISEHSDKTLDIVPDTYIANVSLGAQRTMVFRGKRDPKDAVSKSTEVKPRNTVRASLPHNSMMRMGLVTNMRWMHSIRQDKRREQEKSEGELDFGGCRVSLTFRLIGTFLSKDQSKIWGQGAVAKDKVHARGVLNGPTEEATKMVQAFSLENRTSEFEWQEVYGHGFDVLHMSNTRKLLLSGKRLVDDGVRAMLEHLGLEWTPSSITASVNAESGIAELPLIKLVDTDISRSTVQDHAAVLLYLDAVHLKADSARTPFEYAKLYTRLHFATSLAAREVRPDDLDLWDPFAAEDVYMSGPELSIVDFAFFPALHSLRDGLEKRGLLRLKAYYQRMREVGAIQKLLEISASE